jgi:nucleosome assembly protein 1-like 1
MAEPIPNKKTEVVAPTPQNTPANNAPISSHAQQPGVASIKEGDESGAQNTADLLAQNPHLVNLIHGRLNSLVGRSSGYIESLPAAVRRRISGLKGIQQEHSKLELQLQEEVLELEKKYFSKFEPLYQKRAAIVNGTLEPTDQEVEIGEAEDDSEDEEKDTINETDEKREAVTDADTISGIPEFWLSAMKNQISLAQIITDRDEAALKHLTDVRLEYLEKLGFKLIFEFAPNDYFTNKTITKTYLYSEGNGYGGEFIYDHAEGDKIDWKEGNNLTVIVEQKKQRNKNTKQTRIIKKTVATESFFNFFSPPQPHASDDDDDDIEERLELDYQLGEDIKEKLIPHAIDWFTGEAMGYEEVDDDDLEDIDYDEDDDENMSEDHDDDESDDDDDGTKPKSDAAECKQS